jgi:cbb3-type cytochrome oxidase subunit 1
MSASDPIAQGYNYRIVRQFSVMTVVWGVVGMLVGVIVAAQLAWPELNFDTPWFSFGRLRPLHTNAVIFAFEGARWMACFGLGTLPVMLSGGALSTALMGFVNRARVRWAVGALVIGFGLWTIAAATLMGHGGEKGHAAHSSIQTSIAIDLARSR